MILDLTRTGGLGAVKVHTVVDTTDLPSDEAARVLKMVAAAKEKPPARDGGADRFSYVLTIKADGKKAPGMDLPLSEAKDGALISYMAGKDRQPA